MTIELSLNSCRAKVRGHSDMTLEAFPSTEMMKIKEAAQRTKMSLVVSGKMIPARKREN